MQVEIVPRCEPVFQLSTISKRIFRIISNTSALFDNYQNGLIYNFVVNSGQYSKMQLVSQHWTSSEKGFLWRSDQVVDSFSHFASGNFHIVQPITRHNTKLQKFSSYLILFLCDTSALLLTTFDLMFQGILKMERIRSLKRDKPSGSFLFMVANLKRLVSSEVLLYLWLLRIFVESLLVDKIQALFSPFCLLELAQKIPISAGSTWNTRSKNLISVVSLPSR